MAAFDALQLALSEPTTFVHHNTDRPLWIDLNASKEFGFDVVAFHTIEDVLHEAKWPCSTSMQPILFLSRLLIAAEKNYWPTELEITDFVWVIKKLRHLVESSRTSVIIQTDHSPILDIMQQSSITSTSSTMRMNIRLVRASQFLEQFRLVVRHKPEKEHIIPDVLSRLASANPAGYDEVYSELDTLFTYHATLVKISTDLIKRICDSYLADDWWVKVWKQLLTNDNLGLDKAILPFIFGSTKPPSIADPYFLPQPKLQDHASDFPTSEHASDLPASEPARPRCTGVVQLIYHLDRVTGVRRLCIPPIVAPDLLAIAHGEGQPSFARYHKIISRSWYIWGLTKILRAFICHCPQCLA